MIASCINFLVNFDHFFKESESDQKWLKHRGFSISIFDHFLKKSKSGRKSTKNKGIITLTSKGNLTFWSIFNFGHIFRRVKKA